MSHPKWLPVENSFSHRILKKAALWYVRTPIRTNRGGPIKRVIHEPFAENPPRGMKFQKKGRRIFGLFAPQRTFPYVQWAKCVPPVLAYAKSDLAPDALLLKLCSITLKVTNVLLRTLLRALNLGPRSHHCSPWAFSHYRPLPFST